MRIRELLRTAAAIAGAAALHVHAQNDIIQFEQNFDQGDDAGLERYNPFAPFGAGADFQFAEGALTITAGPSPAPQVSDQVAGADFEELPLTDGKVSIDFWDWNMAENARPVFWVFGRSTETSPGAYSFYSVNLSPGPFPEAVAPYGSTPSLALVKWIDNVPQLPSLASVDLSNLTLNPNERYRLTLAIEGHVLTADLYRLPDSQTPIASVTAQDTSYTSGTWGFTVTDKATRGNPPGNNGIQITVDNFALRGIPAPPSIEFTQDFDQGHDRGLERYNPFAAFGAGADFQFAEGALTITAGPSPAPQVSDQVAGATFEELPLTDGKVSIDFWDWNMAENARPVFWVFGRSTETSPGAYSFYSVNLSPGPFPEAVAPYGSSPSLALIKWVNNVPQLPSLASVDLSDLTLDPSERHRLSLAIEGDVLTAHLYRLPDSQTPIASVSAQDTSYTSGTWGFTVTDKATRGNPPGNNEIQITVDNFNVRGVAAPPVVIVTQDFDQRTHRRLVRYNPFAPFGAGADFEFVDGALTITAGPSPAPQISDQVAGATFEERPLTDGKISIDFWDWNTAENARPVFWVFGRSTETSPGAYSFYSVNLSPGHFPEAVAPYGSSPSLALIKWVNNVPQLPSLASVDLSDLTLDPAERYRLTLAIEGDVLTADLYRLPDSQMPIASVSAQDTSYTSGTWGFTVTDKATRGNPPGNNEIQITVDNFRLQGIPVPSLEIERAVVLSWPASAAGYILEGAPSVNGPWSEIGALPAEIGGENKVTLIVTGELQVFRLREAGTE